MRNASIFLSDLTVAFPKDKHRNYKIYVFLNFLFINNFFFGQSLVIMNIFQRKNKATKTHLHKKMSNCKNQTRKYCSLFINKCFSS